MSYHTCGDAGGLNARGEPCGRKTTAGRCQKHPLVGEPVRKPKIPDEKIVEALERTSGTVAAAARVVGCGRTVIYDRIAESPAVREALENSRELRLDLAEVALDKAVRAGEAWAVCFLLKTLGKPRGYIERAEISGPDGGAIEHRHGRLDPSRLSDEDLLALRAIYRKAGVRTNDAGDDAWDEEQRTGTGPAIRLLPPADGAVEVGEKSNRKRRKRR